MYLESSSWIDQTLSSQSEFVRLLNQRKTRMRDRDETSWDTHFNLNYIALRILVAMSTIKFADNCFKKKTKRVSGFLISIQKNARPCKQLEKHANIFDVTELWMIDLQHLRLTKEQKSTLQCIPFRSFQHFTDFTFNWLYLTPYHALFSHHPHQTPSLYPFRANVIVPQIQGHQSRVRFQTLGQGLTGEIWWTSSPALELIKLWVLPVLPSWKSLQPRDGG